MLSVSSQKLADYRAGAVPIMTFGYEDGDAPATSGLPYSYTYGNDGVFSRQMAALSYESGLGRGFGKGSAMTSIVDMTVTQLQENDVFGEGKPYDHVMWMGFTNTGSDWKSQGKGSEWVRIGDHFRLYRPKVQSSLQKLKGEGVLAGFDRSVSLTSYQYSAETIAEYLAGLLPCTVAVFLEKLCVEAGVSLYSTSFTSSNIEIKTNPFTNNSNVTCRDVLDWILDMTGCYVRVIYVDSGDGTLNPRRYNQIELFTPLAGNVKPLVNIVNMQCSNYDIYIPEVTVEGDGWSITKTRSKSGVYDRRSLTLEACPLLECLGSTTMSRTAAGNMALKWVGQTLCEFEIDLASGWVYEPGDCVSFKDANDKTRYGWITYAKHTMGGVSRIKCELAS